MIIKLAPFKILRPRQSVFCHPAEAFEHTFREYDRNVGSVVNVSPYIRYLRDAEFEKKAFEIDLVNHTLDIRHTDLERRMDMLFTVKVIDEVRVFGGDKSLAVELQNVKIAVFLYAVVPPHRSVAAVVLNRDVICSVNGRRRIVYDDDLFFVPYRHIVDPETVRHDQSVVGVELGKLTFADLHAERDALFDRLVEILSDKGETGVSAHIRRTFKSDVSVTAVAKIEIDPLGTEHGFCFFDTLDVFLLSASAVEDIGEVDIYDNIL